MTSLTDVYEGQVRWVASTRRLYLGIGLLLVGTAMVVTGIVVATTSVRVWLDLGLFEARELAGTLAGIGVPVALLGVLTVPPSSREVRAASVIGASVSLLGVALFRTAYPYQWLGSGHTAFALVTAGVYFLGAITTFVALFVAVATLQTRDAPGGAATMTVTEAGRLRIVEEDGSEVASTVGTFGDTPEGDVATQTNDDRAGAVEPTPTVSDGGAAATDAASTEPTESDAAAPARVQPDTYCGNCEHFRYVHSDGSMVPHCGLDDEFMSDMDACDEWTGNN